MSAELKQQTTSKPDPDPTVLTTEALLREVAGLKELFQAKLDAIEKEMSDMHANVHMIPEQRVAQLAALEKLIEARFATIEEKFLSIAVQFKERDTRVEQTARDTKVAVDAALQAAEKAVGKQNEASSLSIAKSETSTNKQIDQLGELIKTNQTATSDKIDDLKERLLRLEGSDLGDKAAMISRRAQTTSSAQVIGVIAAIVLGLISLVVTIALRAH